MNAYGMKPLLGGLGLATLLATVPTAGAQAMSMKDCGGLYEQAKTAGTLGNMSWNDFRKAKCGTAAAAPAPSPTAAPAPAPAPAPTAAPAPAPALATKTTKAAPAPAAPTAPINTTALQAPGANGEHARIKECGAEWKANKASLQGQYSSWPKYWSACNTRLKTTGH